jgi:integrase
LDVLSTRPAGRWQSHPARLRAWALAEAIDLYWDRLDRNHVDLKGRRPMLRFRAKHQKNRKEQRVPITPDFAAFLMETPEDERTGLVFPMGARNVTTISDVITKIGTKANLVVNSDTGKYASAHDFRRSFGSRWARKVMPAVLQKLMRHADIKTTMKFYADQDAEDVGDVVWKAAEGQSADGIFSSIS